MGLMDHVDQIAKIAEVAGKEFAIEQCLEKMEKDWAPVNLEVLILNYLQFFRLPDKNYAEN